MNDELLEHFLELQEALAVRGISIILGGGLSLYVNLTYKKGDRFRYPFNIQVRPTNDLDVFLTADIIADSVKFESIKNTLEQVLGYKVVDAARWFQFEKDIGLFGSKQTIKVDLLSAPPKEEDLHKVKISDHRVRPKSVKNIHAYLTEEAKGVKIGKQIIEIPDTFKTISIVSNFNYLIFKLHAFEDRINDPDKDYGRHHALDLFYTVARMNEEDWQNAHDHYNLHSKEAYVMKACKIRTSRFSAKNQFGMIRLLENQAYRNNSEQHSQYLEQFMKDLSELFPQ